MFRLDKYRVKIKVNLDYGVYEFEHYSNTGKSYLCFLCKQYHNYGESIDGYDYYDYKKIFLVMTDVIHIPESHS